MVSLTCGMVCSRRDSMSSHFWQSHQWRRRRQRRPKNWPVCASRLLTFNCYEKRYESNTHVRSEFKPIQPSTFASKIAFLAGLANICQYLITKTLFADPIRIEQWTDYIKDSVMPSVCPPLFGIFGCSIKTESCVDISAAYRPLWLFSWGPLTHEFHQIFVFCPPW